MILHLLLLVASILLSSGFGRLPLLPPPPQSRQIPGIEDLVEEWAPLVWLAPGEKFMPLPVTEFLENVRQVNVTTAKNQETFLVTRHDLDWLLSDRSSFLHGEDPASSKVPIYVDVFKCSSKPQHFLVKYWMFFPFNSGKRLCTTESPLGTMPIPLVFGYCLGDYFEYGNHVGDWEHISLLFDGEERPSMLYVSVHETGAYYKYDPNKGQFLYHHQDKILLDNVNFPKKVKFFNNTNHIIVFAAQGSHGLWSYPGQHKYFKIPRLYDDGGFGTKWKTWESVVLLDKEPWLDYDGWWGSPRSDCQFKIGPCRLSRGPPGIRSSKRSKGIKC